MTTGSPRGQRGLQGLAGAGKEPGDQGPWQDQSARGRGGAAPPRLLIDYPGSGQLLLF